MFEPEFWYILASHWLLSLYVTYRLTRWQVERYVARKAREVTKTKPGIIMALLSLIKDDMESKHDSEILAIARGFRHGLGGVGRLGGEADGRGEERGSGIEPGAENSDAGREEPCGG